MYRRTVAVGLVVASLGFTGCHEAVTAEAPARAVRVVTVAPASAVAGARYSGALEPRLQVDLAFKVPGKVALVGTDPETRRQLQEGDRVKSGQLLAALDVRDLQLQVNAAAASADAAQAQVSAAEGSLAQATTEVERARKLFASASIPKSELDRAETAYAAGVSSLAAAKAQHRSRVDQASIARRSLADARLESPIDGILARRGVEPGESVMPGLAAFTVIDPTEMRLVVGVPDTKVNALSLGQQVEVSINAIPGATRSGMVTKIAPTADPALRSFAVEVTVPNADGQLKTGMVASAALAGAGEEPTVRVPLAALVRGTDRGFAVFVVDGGKVAAQTVEIDDLQANDVIVTSGLAAGTRVVSEGAQFLRTGDRIEVMP